MRLPNSPFLVNGVDPLLAEVPGALSVEWAGPADLARAELHRFVGQVFRQAHGAEIAAFYPNLLAFRSQGRLSAVVGYRPGRGGVFFSENYLDRPAQDLAAARLGQPVAREEMVEVGNLAIADPGLARAVIAASTGFLAAAGYRWVLFTAIPPLANAFRRLGLRPMALATADPERLPDRGVAWGDYYQGAPKVYLGDIQAGDRKLRGHAPRHPNLERLLVATGALGALARPNRAAALVALAVAPQ
jgi:hypothetical protein